MIRLPKDAAREIAAHARAGSPREVCGWLAGSDGEVSRVVRVPNAARDPLTHFMMDPQAQISAMREIRESGLEIVGTYHSHPRTPATPSARDLQLAAYPELAHLIVSLANPEPQFDCYRIAAEGVSLLDTEVEQPNPHAEDAPQGRLYGLLEARYPESVSRIAR